MILFAIIFVAVALVPVNPVAGGVQPECQHCIQVKQPAASCCAGSVSHEVIVAAQENTQQDCPHGGICQTEQDPLLVFQAIQIQPTGFASVASFTISSAPSSLLQQYSKTTSSPPLLTPPRLYLRTCSFLI